MRKTKTYLITFILFALSFAFVLPIKALASTAVSPVTSGIASVVASPVTSGTTTGIKKLSINATAIPYASCTSSYTFAGAGTSPDDPYLLSNSDDLTCMSWNVNNNSARYSDKVWSLTDNIDLKGNESNQWTPIGNLSNLFSGSFYGGNHTISGIYIDTKSDYQGFIGYASQTDVISSLGIINSHIVGNKFVGSIAGIIGGTITTFKNLYNTGKVQGTSSYVGGLFGEINGSVQTFKNSYNIGNVSGTLYTGGLVGCVVDYIITLENSYNEGNVNGTVSSVGGLVGCVYRYIETITDSYNTGNINIPSGVYIGGLI